MSCGHFKLLKCVGNALATQVDCNKNPAFLSTDAVSTLTYENPIAAPLSATSTGYSYEVFLKWECIATPNYYISNFKFWGPSKNPNYPLESLVITGGTVSTATTPKNIKSVLATFYMHKYYNNLSAASILNVTASTGDGNIDSVGEQTNYVVMQLHVGYGSSQGRMPTQIFNISYEET